LTVSPSSRTTRCWSWTNWRSSIRRRQEASLTCSPTAAVIARVATGEARAAKRWLAFFLSSGEVSLAEHACSERPGRRSSARHEVRILDIEAGAGKGLGLFDHLCDFPSGDQLARTMKAGAAEHYGIAGPEFVRKLLGQVDQVPVRVREGSTTLSPTTNQQTAMDSWLAPAAVSG
jgi:hypothetical protein